MISYENPIFKLNWGPLALYIILFIIYIILLPGAGLYSDIFCWREWSKYMFTHGLGNVYQSEANYMPLYLYVLHLYGQLQGSIEAIVLNLKYLKLFTLVFDFIGGWFLILSIKESVHHRGMRFLYSLLFFVNFPYLYNNLFWAQVDGILSTLIFGAVFFAIRQKVLASLLMMVLAVNFKLQAIIFLPIFVFLLFPVAVRKYSIHRLTLWLVAPIVLQFLILLPFILANQLNAFSDMVVGSFSKYPVVSMNAFNIWAIFLQGNLMEISDTNTFFGITYKSWGLAAFFGFSVLALWPVFTNAIRRVTKNETSLPLEKIMIAASLVALLFFFLNTEMHERYTHPAIIFITVYTILSRRYWSFIIVCTAYFLNMEAVLQYFFLDYEAFYFSQKFIAFLYLFCIILLFFDLYIKKEKPSEQPAISI